jgi:hypothetical protein
LSSELAFLWDDKQAQLPDVKKTLYTTTDDACKESEAMDNPHALPQ